jgi:hypothetical protein
VRQLSATESERERERERERASRLARRGHTSAVHVRVHKRHLTRSDSICFQKFLTDFSIVNIALPSIQAELHVTAASLQWLITGYALTYGSLLLTGGRIGDLAGK